MSPTLTKTAVPRTLLEVEVYLADAFYVNIVEGNDLSVL